VEDKQKIEPPEDVVPCPQDSLTDRTEWFRQSGLKHALIVFNQSKDMQSSSSAYCANSNVPVSSPAITDPSSLVAIFSRPPTYPPLARDHGIWRTVTLLAGIAPDGSVRDLRDVKGNPILAQASKDAITQWRYQPYPAAGHELVWRSIVVNFGPK
jgi:outer membrane biosynthesis protein TonB